MAARRYVFPLLLSCAVTASAGACYPGRTQAEDSPSFRGKTINFIVSFPAGGGYDAYGRLLARTVGNHLPGNPGVVVQNMPGAGGLVGMNNLYNVAPRDGTSLGIVAPTAALAQLLDQGTIKYDVREVTWVGRIVSNTAVLYTSHKTTFRSIADAKTREVVVAGTGPTSSSVVVPKLLNALTGTRFKVVTGYSGTTDAHLALERGEVEGISKNWSNVKVENADWLRNGQITLVLQFGLQRDRELADVPTLVELAQNDEQRQILELFASSDAIGVAVAAPPRLDPGVTRALRDGFMRTMQDPRLLDEARQRKVDLDPLPGEELEKIIARMLSIPPTLLARAKGIVQGQ